jgi:site-specific recombinase XerC
VKVQYVKRVRKGDRLHFYLNYPGTAKLIPIPDPDSPGFLAAYLDATRQAKDSLKIADPGTVAMAISDYLRSPAFAKLGKLTQIQRRNHLNRIALRAKHALLADLLPKHVQYEVDSLGGHPGVNRLKAWRGFLAWAKRSRLIETDPSRDVTRPERPKSDGHVPWTVADVARFRAYWTDGPQRIAMEIAQWTGAAAQDLAKLGPGMVKDNALTYRRGKTLVTFTVPVVLPPWGADMAADHAQFLAATADPQHLTWIVTEAGASRSTKAIGQWFAEMARKAGVPKSLHGLRKYRAQRLIEAGASQAQRKAWIGHLTDAESDHYAKGADQRKILGLETAAGNLVETNVYRIDKA